MRKKALITGASRGIGEAIAKELARQGFDLTLTCLNSLDRLKELGKKIRHFLSHFPGRYGRSGDCGSVV